MTAVDRADVPVRTAPGARRGAPLIEQLSVLSGRSLRPYLREPQLLIFTMLQPLITLLLFSQVFSGIADTPGFPAGVSYVDYLLPSLLVTTGLSTGMQSGVLLIEDARNGLMARFRSLPISPLSVLGARSVADTARAALQLPIIIVAGALVFGFRPAGLAGTLGGVLLTVLVTGSLTWIFLAAAAWLRSPEKMQMIVTLLMFPLTFASNAYVPVTSLPGWLRPISAVNPLSYAMDAVRSLMLGPPAPAAIAGAVVSCTVVAGAGMLLAARGFRRW
ncbi:ABC transporter permease [Actinoplanes sp. RD1]|uniref:ABC transporter permease n=1 Tax=Actinoplanes sp. RD1 TaxID=3064538 RepID=UPI0027428695|nr:ABC transporter permease [Actinoplanes sp. RD1]